MMKQQFPDYNNSITSLAVSILEEFGIKSGKQGLQLVDPYLQKGHENIVILLLDGMGTNIIRQNLDKNGFFNSHYIGTYSSVFPPTTVAATTSILSGKNPCEHCWLGWDCYYPQIDKNVTVFYNTESGTDQPAAPYNVASKYCGYKSIITQINENGGNAYEVTPFVSPFPDTFSQICKQVKKLCCKPEKKFIYAYWSEPDHTMHAEGCYTEISKQVVSDLETQVKLLCDSLKDAVVIVTADHGHINSKGVCLYDYPRIAECLVRSPSIEPRTLNLFVKEDKKKQFESEFEKEFGGKFLLMTKEEVLDKKMFGDGVEHPCFRDMIGDYLTIAIDDLSIFNTKKEVDYFVGVHSGLTQDEMNIPLIIIEKEKDE